MVQDPIAGEQFTASACGWGIVTLVGCILLRQDWVRKGSYHPDGYAEVAPPWAYDASAKITFLWAPVALLYLSFLLCFPGHHAGADEFLNRREFVDHLIHGGMFGLMVKDFFLCYETPDVLLLFHHLVVMALTVCLGTIEGVQGGRISTIVTICVELGSACYCLHILHNRPLLYCVAMNLSNAVFTVGAYVLCTMNMETRPIMSWSLSICALAVVVGRQAVMCLSLRKIGMQGLILCAGRKVAGKCA